MARRETDPFEGLSVAEVIVRLGYGQTHTVFAEGRKCTARCTTEVDEATGEVRELHPHWRQGDPRPALADEDPAVMCAIGRCATNRLRFGMPLPSGAGLHPKPCGWCDYPLDQLLLALDWSAWFSRFIVSESMHWPNYSRQVRSNVFENPRWAEFDTLTRKEREYRVEQAIEASRS